MDKNLRLEACVYHQYHVINSMCEEEGTWEDALSRNTNKSLWEKMLEWSLDGDIVKEKDHILFKARAQRKAISEIQTDESIDVNCI